MKHHIMQINHILTLILYYGNKISTTVYVKEKLKNTTFSFPQSMTKIGKNYLLLCIVIRFVNILQYK